MKRIKRNPAKFDAIELFTAIGREKGYRLNTEGDLQSFLDIVKDSLQASQTNPQLLHGKRVEALFAHVAAAMGGCRMIKQEDAGSVFAASGNLIVPDYRIVLRDGTAMLVEVKNFHMKSFDKCFSLPVKTMRGLEEYAELNGLALKFAIYFSTPNVWVLLPKSAFKRVGKHFVVTFPQAIARNEMASLGDRAIATLPRLSLEFRTTPDLAIAPDENSQVVFTIKSMKFECGGKEVIGEAAREIALYLMRYGRWPGQESEAIFEEGKVIAIRFTFEPEARQPNQGFEIIGSLSEMISSAYRELTVGDDGIVSLDIRHEPEAFTLRIPQDFKNETLPLWQFVLQPNDNFGNLDKPVDVAPVAS